MIKNNNNTFFDDLVTAGLLAAFVALFVSFLNLFTRKAAEEPAQPVTAPVAVPEPVQPVKKKVKWEDVLGYGLVSLIFLGIAFAVFMTLIAPAMPSYYDSFETVCEPARMDRVEPGPYSSQYVYKTFVFITESGLEFNQVKPVEYYDLRFNDYTICYIHKVVNKDWFAVELGNPWCDSESLACRTSYDITSVTLNVHP